MANAAAAGPSAAARTRPRSTDANRASSASKGRGSEETASLCMPQPRRRETARASAPTTSINAATEPSELRPGTSQSQPLSMPDEPAVAEPVEPAEPPARQRKQSYSTGTSVTPPSASYTGLYRWQRVDWQVPLCIPVGRALAQLAPSVVQLSIGATSAATGSATLA